MKSLKPKAPDPVERLRYVRRVVEKHDLPLIQPLSPLNGLASRIGSSGRELSDILLYYLLTYGDEIEKLNTLIKDAKLRFLVTTISKAIKFVAKKFYAH